MVKKLLHDESGTDLIEYGLLLALVVIGVAILMPGLVGQLTNLFGVSSDHVYDLWVPNNPGS